MCRLHHILDAIKNAVIFRIEQDEPKEHGASFSVSEYLARVEQASLEIAENYDPVDKVIVLWWGLDGLQMNEDGSSEWISRKRKEPVNQNAFYQPCQSIQPVQAGALCTIAEMNALMAQHNANLQTQLLFSQISYPGHYPSYFYGGMAAYAPPAYSPQMQNCCCNWIH